MVVEWLICGVAPEHQADFIACDAAIWTAFLTAQPGFAGKEVWRNQARPGELNLMIRWTSLQAWKAIPAQDLAATDARFQTAFGRPCPILDCLTYDVLG